MARLRVAATSADNQAVGQYRVWEPLRALLKHDLVEMIALPTLNIHCKETATGNRVVGVDAPDADVLILQRPTNWAIADSIPFFQRAGLAVVIDLDDDIRHTADKHSQRTIYDPRYNPHENWRHLLRACSHADLVVVSTPALSVYAPHGRYEVVRNCVPERYLDVERKTDGRTVGWGGTVLNHPGDLLVTNGGVASAVREAGARFMVVGDGSDVRRHLHLDEEPTKTGLISISEYPLRVAEFTVGIAPLERSEFNDAKSFLKLLEYAALSVPFVASANTPEYLYASTFLKGFFVKDRGRSWRRAVLDYLEDPGLRAEHAAHNREEVRANWTMEGQCENWLRAWEHAVDNREAAK